MLVRLAVRVGMAPPVAGLRAAGLEATIADAGFEILDSRVYNPKSRLHCILARRR